MNSAGWLVLLVALLAAVPPALAEPGDGRPGAGRAGRFSAEGAAERQALREQHRALRSELRGDSSRDDAGASRCDGPCRMNPEERRQLRRDIDDAGRDLYRRGPRGGRE